MGNDLYRRARRCGWRAARTAWSTGRAPILPNGAAIAACCTFQDLLMAMGPDARMSDLVGSGIDGVAGTVGGAL